MKEEEKKHRRTGVIARLPRELREQVNRMLDDGRPYESIIEWLGANGHPGVNKDHISNWKDGGYQDHVELELELARQEKVREMSYEIAAANEGNKTQEAAIQVAASFLFQVFRKFDPEKLMKELDLKPTQIPTVLNAFTRLNRRATDIDLIKDFKRREEERKAAEAEKGKVAPGLKAGLSKQNHERIESDFNLT